MISAGTYPNATMTCPLCGKQAVLVWSGAVLLSNPPQRPYSYKCACGYVSPTSRYTDRSQRVTWMDHWKEVNQ